MKRRPEDLEYQTDRSSMLEVDLPVTIRSSIIPLNRWKSYFVRQAAVYVTSLGSEYKRG